MRFLSARALSRVGRASSQSTRKRLFYGFGLALVAASLTTAAPMGHAQGTTSSGTSTSNSVEVGNGTPGDSYSISGWKPGKSYLLSATGKLSDNGATGYVGVWILDGSNNSVGNFSIPFQWTSSVSQSTVFTVPFSAKEIHVYVRRAGKGVFSASNIQVTETAAPSRPPRKHSHR